MGRPPSAFCLMAAAALVCGLALFPLEALAANPCSGAKMTEILRPATDESPAVRIDCNFTFPSDPASYMPSGVSFPGYISKKLDFRGAEAAGVMFDCAGKRIIPTSSEGSKITLMVRSRQLDDGTWSRPRDLTIRNCEIDGTIRIVGADTDFDSNHSPGYTARAQASAPTRIHFDRIVLNAKRLTDVQVPMYFGQGVTYSSLTRSEIRGQAEGVPIYLTMESAHNTIKDNYIHATSSMGREQLALDGSANNRIINNHFSALSHGGIYIYRNCGEKGTVRHQKPWHNHIINNYFYYENYIGGNPSIWVAQRTRYIWPFGLWNTSRYCDLDDNYPFGSGIDNTDNAKYTVAAQNQIRKRSASDMIRDPVSQDTGSRPFYKFSNTTVSSRISRRAGCFVAFKSARGFVTHGQTAAIGISETFARKYSCDDSDLRYHSSGAPETIQFQCARGSSNSGCSAPVACPAGKRLVAIRAACHLESATGVSETDVRALPWDTLRVKRASDQVDEGRCAVDEIAIRSGSTSLGPVLSTRSSVTVSCREHDQNGGDCVVRGEAQCF